MNVSYTIKRATELAALVASSAVRLSPAQFKHWFENWHQGTRDEAIVILSLALAIAVYEHGIGVVNSVLVVLQRWRDTEGAEALLPPPNALPKWCPVYRGEHVFDHMRVADSASVCGCGAPKP